MQEQTIADLTSLNLFGEVDVEILSPPTLTATATGSTGTTSVAYSDPIVRINGEELVDEIEIEIGTDGTADLPSPLDPLARWTPRSPSSRPSSRNWASPPFASRRWA